MTSPHDLRLYVVPPGKGADFVLRRHGGLAPLEPLNEGAAEWLSNNVGDETTWQEGRLAIEMRYIGPIIDAIIDEGFLFEGDEGGSTH